MGRFHESIGRAQFYAQDRKDLPAPILTRNVFFRTLAFMSINPEELQKLLDELEASRRSRRRAWENLQEIRWVLKDTAGMDLPPPAPE
jgi:hypothetical protein